MPAPTTRQLDVLRYLNAGAKLHTDSRRIGTIRLDIETLRRSTVEQLRDAGWIHEVAPGIWTTTEEGRAEATTRDRVHDYITDLT